MSGDNYLGTVLRMERITTDKLRIAFSALEECATGRAEDDQATLAVLRSVAATALKQIEPDWTSDPAPEGGSMKSSRPGAKMPRRPAYWTHNDGAAEAAGHFYYFAPTTAAPPQYLKQRRVTAIIDIADDGTLAGVELIDDMPPPPLEGEKETMAAVFGTAALRALGEALFGDDHP